MFTGLGGERLWLCPSLNDSANDISGNGNNGTYNGGMATIADVSSGGSRCYFSNAQSQSVSVANFGDSLAETTTISMWTKSTNPYVCVPIVNGGFSYSASSWQYAVFNSTTTRLLWRRSTNLAFPAATPSNQWQHVCVVRETGSSTQEAYVDGILVATSASNSATYGINTLWSGFGNAIGTGEELYVDDIRTYGRVLTQAEITYLATYRGVLGNPYYKPLTLKSRVTRLLSNRPTTLLERIRSASKPTTPISIKVKHNEEPSYKAGYAKSAGESENPHLWNGLVGAWMPSLGVTGETLRDVSGNGKHGTLTNMDASNFSFSDGGSIFFNGSNEYGSFGSSEIWAVGLSDFSLRISIHPSVWKSSWTPIFVVGNSGGLWVGKNASNQFVLRAYGVADLMVANLPANYQKTDVVITRRSGVGRIYYGGKLVSTASVNHSFASGNLWLADDGFHSAIELFQGNLSNISIYNRALSPQEIQELYVDSLAPFRRKKSPIGYQPIKEVKGLIRT